MQPLGSKIRRTLLLVGGIAFLGAAISVATLQYQQHRHSLVRVMTARIDITQGIISELLRLEQARVRGILHELTRQNAPNEIRLLERALHIEGENDLFYVLDQDGRVSLISKSYRQYLGLSLNANRSPVSIFPWSPGSQ